MTELLERVVDAVLSCKDIVTAPFSVTEKDSLSNIVTSADQAVERYLQTKLLEILPEAGFLGEEGAETQGKEYLFVVDPIDGTSNFTRRIPNSAISVGLKHQGEGILGVVYNIFTGELYYAQAGQGAFCNGEPIRVSKRDFSHAMYYTALSTYRREYSAACMRILDKVFAQCDDFRREGSAALELCCLARGSAELYFEARLFPWDVCAAEVILKEAGGVSQRLYAEHLAEDQPFPIIAANNSENLEKLRAIVAEEFPALPEGYHK